MRIKAYRRPECRIIPRRLPVRLCSGSRLPGNFAGTRAFRSLDAGARMHGGVLSMWGVLKACQPQAMEFEETKPQINADERRFNALSEEKITGATHLSLFKY
ncbi:MAG: hypothetical protein L6282_05360 [Candidatus Methanoperedenaceae archaeon]|nr:hypothetical protein [Candidatus Methanoperedenaceae archaeon]